MKVKKPSMLRMLHKNQRGFTLIELTVVVAIIGLIAGAASTAIYQVFSGNARSSSHMTAVRQVQTAGYWISLDAQMAKNIDAEPSDDPSTQGTEVLILLWEGGPYGCGDSNTCINSYEVHYTYDAASEKLWRYQKITTNKYNEQDELIETTYSPSAGWDTTFIAEYITPIEDEYVTMDDDGKLIVTITASVTSWVGYAVEERTYEITPRPSPSD